MLGSISSEIFSLKKYFICADSRFENKFSCLKTGRKVWLNLYSWLHGWFYHHHYHHHHHHHPAFIKCQKLLEISGSVLQNKIFKRFGLYDFKSTQYVDRNMMYEISRLIIMTFAIRKLIPTHHVILMRHVDNDTITHNTRATIMLFDIIA